MFKNKKIQNSKKGVSIYLVILISTFIFTVALGLSTILISRIKVSREIGYSVVAFYAADTGIERVLVQRNNPQNISETSLPNGATYEVSVISGGSCTAPNYCIKSIGKYKGVRRAIEITY